MRAPFGTASLPAGEEQSTWSTNIPMRFPPNIVKPKDESMADFFNVTSNNCLWARRVGNYSAVRNRRGW